MARTIRGMFYVIFAGFGGLTGYSLANYTQRFWEALSKPGLYTVFGSLILLGILLGVVVAPWLANLVIHLVDRTAVALQKATLQEVLMGSTGLLFGLIIAFFVNLAIRSIDFASIPGFGAVVGVYLGPLLIILTTIFLGYLGAYVGSRVVFIHSLKQLLEGGRGITGWGRNTILLDTSAIVDGRIADVCATGFLDGVLVVPQFVLDELQQIADSGDSVKRNRGRRGLEMLHTLRKNHRLHIDHRDYEDGGVDAKLVRLAREYGAPLCTTDYNLNRVASLQGITVLNINELAQALKPVVLPGEHLAVRLIKPGKESGQGVGYLDDGTMVVVEEGRRHIDETVLLEVTSVVQTAAGKMIFGRYRGSAPALDAGEPGAREEGGDGVRLRGSAAEREGAD